LTGLTFSEGILLLIKLMAAASSLVSSSSSSTSDDKTKTQEKVSKKQADNFNQWKHTAFLSSGFYYSRWGALKI